MSITDTKTHLTLYRGETHFGAQKMGKLWHGKSQGGVPSTRGGIDGEFHAKLTPYYKHRHPEKHAVLWEPDARQ